jgi:hypothetical protein
MGSTGLLESTHAVGRESRNLLGSLLFRSLLRVAVCPSVGIPKQRDRSSRRPSIDLLLVELVEGKACLSTKAEPRRCWSTCPLSAEQSSVPDVIRREQLDHCASFGDWAGSTATSEGASRAQKAGVRNRSSYPKRGSRSRDVKVPWRPGRPQRFRRLQTARGKEWRSTRFWCWEETCCW